MTAHALSAAPTHSFWGRSLAANSRTRGWPKISISRCTGYGV
ncbi:MAG: hypothetical protein ACRD3N_12935 [Terracidiphilus sp.]